MQVWAQSLELPNIEVRKTRFAGQGQGRGSRKLTMARIGKRASKPLSGIVFGKKRKLTMPSIGKRTSNQDSLPRIVFGNRRLFPNLLAQKIKNNSGAILLLEDTDDQEADEEARNWIFLKSIQRNGRGYVSLTRTSRSQKWAYQKAIPRLPEMKDCLAEETCNVVLNKNGQAYFILYRQN